MRIKVRLNLGYNNKIWYTFSKILVKTSCGKGNEDSVCDKTSEGKKLFHWDWQCIKRKEITAKYVDHYIREVGNWRQYPIRWKSNCIFIDVPWARPIGKHYTSECVQLITVVKNMLSVNSERVLRIRTNQTACCDHTMDLCCPSECYVSTIYQIEFCLLCKCGRGSGTPVSWSRMVSWYCCLESWIPKLIKQFCTVTRYLLSSNSSTMGVSFSA